VRTGSVGEVAWKSAGSSNGPSVEARNANAVCLEPLPFVPGSILPGLGQFPKINLHKFWQNDFSVVPAPFFTPQKNQKNPLNHRKIAGPGLLSLHNATRSGVFTGQCTAFVPPKCPRCGGLLRRLSPRRAFESGGRGASRGDPARRQLPAGGRTSCGGSSQPAGRSTRWRCLRALRAG
jgi:hypothetical protein